MRWDTTQIASNDLVRNALTLNQPCKDSQNDPKACAALKETALREAATSQARLEAQLAQATHALDIAKEAGFQSDAATDNAKSADRRAAAAFARLLDTYPDTKSLLGTQDYAKLSATSEGTAASIKLGVGRHLPSGWRETALIISTPEKLGKNRLYSSADGLASSTTFELSNYSVKALDTSRKIPGFDKLYVWGLSLKAGFETNSYYDVSELSKSTSTTQHKWAASTYAALYAPAAKNPDVHLVKLELQRGIKLPDGEFRCSVPKSATDTSVNCVNGLFGAPKREYSRLYAYEWRIQSDWFAASPSFSYNDVSRVKELNIPWFLIRGETDAKPFNAGINFHWSNKVGGSVGVFVGTPFSLAIDR
jgi:hypothetical protein